MCSRLVFSGFGEIQVDRLHQFTPGLVAEALKKQPFHMNNFHTAYCGVTDCIVLDRSNDLLGFLRADILFQCFAGGFNLFVCW